MHSESPWAWTFRPRSASIFPLQYLYGIGVYRAKQILAETHINPATRARDLKDDEIARIASFIDKNYKTTK